MSKIIHNIVAFLTGLLLFLNLLSYLGAYYFLFDLLTHFRLQYLFLFFLASLFFVVFFNKKWILLSLVGFCFNSLSILPIYFPESTDAVDKTENISLLLVNVLSSNQSYSALLEQVDQKQADFIVILELHGYELTTGYPVKKLN